MRLYVYVLSLMLILMAGAGCDRLKATASTSEPESTKAEPSKEAAVVIPVQVELPHRSNIASHFETTSRVEAENRVQVMAEGIGECEKLYVREGDRVKAGDLLAELDKKTVQATIGQTEVQVRQTKTAFDIAERSLAEGIGAKAERDNARFAHEQALAALNMQRVQLAKLTIRAPIGGVITKRNIQEGQLVSAATPTFNIVDPESFMLVINPPEKELPRLKLGQTAEVTVDALGDQVFEVKVRRINPNVDPASGTVKVTLDFDKAIQSQLRESAFARVRLVLETHENALLIAKDTLVEENARKYVFVVKPVPKDDTSAKEAAPKEAAPKADAQPEAAAPESAKPEADAAKPDPGAPGDEQEKPQFVAERVEVQVGLEDSKAAEILSGIEDSSLVVTLGQHTLKTGSFVTITNATDELLKKAGLSADEALKAAKTDRTGQKRGSFEGHHGPHPQH